MKRKLTCGTVMAAAADPSMPGVGGQWRLRLRLLVHFSSLILKKSLNRSKY
jgi:hypothetical protein